MIVPASHTTITRASSDTVNRFINQLKKLTDNEDRASLAKLRRSLIQYGRDFSAYTVLGYALPTKVSEQKESIYLLIAGLYAMHSELVEDGRSLGASLQRLRVKLGNVGGASLDALVGGLLNAEAEDLPIRLRHVIARLASNEVPIDYAQLLRGLLAWESPSCWVQRRWAHDYWVARDDSESDFNSDESSEPDASTHVSNTSDDSPVE